MVAVLLGRGVCASWSSLQTLWRIMHNYYQVRRWHYSESRVPATTPLSLLSAGLGEEERTTAELAFDRNYVRQKLDNGLVRIWRVSCCNPVSIMLPSLLLYRMFSRRCDHIYWQWTCLAFSMIL